MTPFYYLDTETTGLLLPQAAPLDAQPHIVELCILSDTGDKLHTLLRPPISIPPEVTKIHGVSDETVAGAPTFAEMADEIAAWMQGHVIRAYNASFDQNMLRYEFKRLDRILPVAHWQDPMHMAQMDTGKRWKQTDLYAALTGKKLVNAHNALADTLGLREICEALDVRRANASR